MPASTPGRTNADDTTGGVAVTLDARSGVKSSPLDNDETGNFSTGALVTGIGYGPNVGPQGFNEPTFLEDYVPGKTKPDGTTASDATYMYLGGGASKKHNDDAGEANAQPITSNFGIVAAGGTIDRDDVGEMKAVVAEQDTAPGATLTVGYINASSDTVRMGDLQFGVEDNV